MLSSTRIALALAAILGAQLANATDYDRGGARNVKPRFIAGDIRTTCYDGKTDDLLTAGLGATGLAGAAPAFANPLAPTAAELRRNAIHTNYRAVLDITPGGGYGTLYGPNVDRDGNVTTGQGLIAGCEHIAYADDGSGRGNVVLMVQIPASFDPRNPCIVTGTASGSRGIFGAIGASGEWGLKRGCAVAYTDKGTGNGLHDLQANTVHLIDGTRSDAVAAGRASHFTAELTEAERTAFNAATPNRVAYKHAHSQQNPERDWGRNTLQAVRLAFYLINEQFGAPHPAGGKRVTIDRRDTIVIASAISNGGTGGLAAAEQDWDRLIDGVAVSEPNAQPAWLHGLQIKQGSETVPTIGKPLYDYFTFANLYQPCAALAPSVAGAPALAFLPAAPAAARCAGLRAKGLLAGNTLVEQANESLDKLRAYGWTRDADVLHASHYRFATNAIAVTYANAYARASVADNVCGFSFANTDAAGAPIAQLAALQAGLFATGNGVPPTTGVNIVYNPSVGGARLDLLAVSPSTLAADLALDGAICHRNLVEGRDIVTGAPLAGSAALVSARLQQGIREVLLTGDLRGKPTIITAGRADALVPPNHAARAYFGTTQLANRHRHARNVRYIEVANAQHFDAFLPGGAVFGGYEKRFVPLHVYFIRSLDWMYAHLKEGKRLPPSQVVRGTPRCADPSCAVAPPITAANVPPILANPAGHDVITFQRGTLGIPD